MAPNRVTSNALAYLRGLLLGALLWWNVRTTKVRPRLHPEKFNEGMEEAVRIINGFKP